jgi:iron(II)-dependent oxidoreductase
MTLRRLAVTLGVVLVGVTVSAGAQPAQPGMAGVEDQTGSLEILTKPPGARIELDGVPVGSTPQRLAWVRVGKHQVVLLHQDYQAVEREVAIEYEQLARLEAELQPQPGRIVVTSTPEQAEVWLGDRKLGVTVWAGELPPGQHRIRVAKEGYEDALFDLLLDPNDAKSLDARLKKWDFGEMVLVAAGEFWMGSDNGDPDERPRHRIYLDAYHIDTYEVTNAEYERFVDATREPAPGYWTDARFNEPRQPVVGVTWEDADTYCRWAGKRLPTEAEWEKAARGTDGRVYPWGDQWDASRANSNESHPGKPAPVGSYPTGVSPYGAHDMAGNVWQWVADWYDKDYYGRSPERNPKGPDSGTYRVLRGGSWSFDPVLLRTTFRYTFTPFNRYDSIGIRCARGAP